MGLGKLLSFKRSKPKAAEETVSTEKEETEQPKANNANIVYPFHDVKATSFPPPLSIDASVYTDPNLITTESQITEIPDRNGKQVPQKDEQVKNEIEDKMYEEHGVCDSKTCAKEKCNAETCAKVRQNGGQRDASFKNDEKIGQDKLTEMINSSIKEAMQTIVKQCRMDGEDKKVKDLDRSVCHRKSKYDYRSRQRSKKSGVKSGHFREKHDNVLSKRLHDENVRSHDKGDEERSKKRKKLESNVRTDNRKMTGNVNIYICSEANENTQPAKSKKAQQPCTESSSETTTDRSDVSSSKLVTCIRNKRRKFKEQNSLDLLRKKEESSDHSNSSSLVSKSTDVESGRESNDFIDVSKEMIKKDAESTSTECECKDSSDATIDRSDQSFRRAKFVVCDDLEKPCSTIYPSKMPSKSDSEEWSSICSSRNEYSSLDTLRGSVPCDKRRGQPEFDYGDYYANNLKEETKRKTCRCRKQNREPIDGGEKRRKKENFVQPSTCACIAEEEEDACAEDYQKSTVCRNVSRSFERSEEKFVACTEVTEKEPEEKTVEKESTDDETKKTEVPRLTSLKLIRPEVLVLKNILKQTKPAVQSNISTRNMKVNLSEQSSNNPSDSQAKNEPAFLKKFNLREQHKFVKRSDAEEGQTSQKLEDEVSEAAGNEEGARKTFSERVKSSLLYKTLRKVVENVSPERKTGKVEDTIGEDSKDSTDKKSEAPKTAVDDQLTDSKEPKAKEKFLPGINIYKMMKMKRSKKESNVASEKIPGKVENSKPGSTEAEEQKDLQEGVKKDAQEKEKEGKKDVLQEKEKEEKKDVLQEKEKKDDQEEEKDVLQKKEKNLQEEEKGKEETIEQHEDKVKSITAKKEPSHKDTKIEEEKTGSKIERVFKSQEAKIESGPAKYTEIRKKSDQSKDPEIKKPEDRSKRITHSDEATVCVQCVRRKSLDKQFIPSQCSQVPSEPHTTCVNSKFTRCTDANNNYPLDNELFNESRCNCVPISQCTNEFVNHPKSCLKKERQFRCVNSQETNASILCCDKRNWEECGCRRMVFCEDCRRPRTECCCRFTYVSCTNCCKPRSKCSCKSICKSTYGHARSMFCLYCDNPREKCTCRSPLGKCSYCELSTDLCRCNQKTIRDGRPVLTEPDNDRTMYVTAWKPREEIRRYFSRKLDVLRTDSINECWCHEKLKHRNSDDLPYQRLSVFSDVMDELQQKLSESTCCTRCRKIPCCCNIEADEGRDERKIKCCVSPKTRRKLVAVCVEKPMAKSLNNYKCDTVKEKNDRQRKIIVSLCCECKSTPCRCKKNKSSQKKPRAKCYYCKNSPCACIASGDCNKPRPCRCTDSPRRTKEKENAPRGKTSTKPKNNDEKIICVR